MAVARIVSVLPASHCAQSTPAARLANDAVDFGSLLLGPPIAHCDQAHRHACHISHPPLTVGRGMRAAEQVHPVPRKTVRALEAPTQMNTVGQLRLQSVWWVVAAHAERYGNKPVLLQSHARPPAEGAGRNAAEPLRIPNISDSERLSR